MKINLVKKSLAQCSQFYMIISGADLQEKSNFQSLIQPQYTFGLLIVISLLHASNFVFSEMTTMISHGIQNMRGTNPISYY
ncbi:hypothetical protein NC653_027052 [Populus alba x Populus x berolinensis]|uniref:Uncharacterized protein n=1 Tax=Populus alba x Populus x berolinensis TaxID=444605 RepID=A0AAD6Q4B8_9ROSI|nr:hypothetical protein NC653_027052 [Populus alba x Populus x berolinensis]